jgi:23S rRNA pseudouridine1911/1915/1917 synthase
VRLDQAIAFRFPDVSRRKARELLSAHRVLVNERPVSVASREVGAEDRIVIVDELPPLTVLRQTDDWIAIDKPSGIPVQPARDRLRRSVEEMLRVQLKQSGVSPSLYVVHRLDTGTSGVVVFARTQAAAADLSRAFADREMRKLYVALVEGTVERGMVLDSPIDGRDAATTVRPLRRTELGTLVEAEIHTGRTHQIRIHLSRAGHAVAGDRRYGATVNMSRLMLHAWKLEHPSIGMLEAPLPAELTAPEPHDGAAGR